MQAGRLNFIEGREGVTGVYLFVGQAAGRRRCHQSFPQKVPGSELLSGHPSFCAMGDNPVRRAANHLAPGCQKHYEVARGIPQP